MRSWLDPISLAGAVTVVFVKRGILSLVWELLLDSFSCIIISLIRARDLVVEYNRVSVKPSICGVFSSIVETVSRDVICHVNWCGR